MKKLLLILFTVNCFSQTPTIQWQKNLGGSGGDYAQSIKQTSDGGYIVAGYTNSSNNDVTLNYGSDDVWIVKLSSSGNIQWKKTYGGTNEDRAENISLCSDGGYIIAGYTYSNNGDVSVNNGGRDYWVLKINSSGFIQWEKTFGQSGDDEANSVQQTSDGGYVVTGTIRTTTNAGSENYWVIKLNASGTTVWQKQLGGMGYDYSNSIQQTSDGGYIVGGYSDSTTGDVTGNHGQFDYWILKLNSSGILQWQKSLGGTDGDLTKSIKQTSDGGYIVVGYTGSNNGDVTNNHGNSDIWIVKLNSTGTIQWKKTLGGSDSDYATSVQQTNDNGFLISGYSGSNDGDIGGNYGGYDAWIAKLNSSGTIQWKKNIGGSGYDFATSIQQSTNGGYIFAGYTQSSDRDVNLNLGFYDFWVVKLSSETLSNLDFEEDIFTIYPNPAKTNITIQTPKDIRINNIAIFDNLGRTILEKKISQNHIDISSIPNGVYFIKIESDGLTYQQKFIKQ